MKEKLLLLCGLLFAHSGFAQPSREPIKVTDLLKIQQVGGITLTADGRKAAFTVLSTEPDAAKKSDYKNVSQVYVVNTDGTATVRQLTYAKEGAAQPAWSPDGRQLAFTRTVDEKPQVFLLASEGGEAVQLTHYTLGASSPKWSPDGKQILFSASIPINTLLRDSLLNPAKALPRWSFEKPGFDKNEQLVTSSAKPNADGSLAEIRAYLENDVVDKKAKVLTKLNFQDERDVSADQSFTQFFVVDAVAGAKPVAVTHGFYDFKQVDFTPDGQHLILTGQLDSLQNPDRSRESQIFMANRNGTQLRLLLGQKGVSYTSATVSPSGKWLAFQFGPASYASVATLAVMPLAGSSKDIVTLPLDRAKAGLAWSQDDKYLYFTAQSNGGVPLYRAKLSNRKVEKLADYDSGITSFGVARDKVVFARTEIANPSGLYLADAELKKVKSIGHFNDWVQTRQLSRPEKHTFVNDKGLNVDYWVMKPTAYQAGKKYPLLLEIHGGPAAMWGPGEASMWHEFQYFCSQGYGVVYADPRGSGGYGLEFLRANVNDWGTGPSKDVLTALDKTVAEGWADAEKLAITGGSYGGYLVAWIISHDHRFKAACSQRGVYDLATFFGEGNAWQLVPDYFGGYPWEPAVKATLVRESPITTVQNITTPYIMFHGENDRRTGFVQGEMLYRSLKVLNRPVEYVRHPGGTHELTRSGDNRQRIDQMLRTYEFFARYIQP
ncbi:S9 family peptidase [Hymenobacter jejuensis]|uniref:S9 family peptidase n=1 Tax=Hymenobacter jejuensis TaxID=2502781 RepID=A0A5B7ZXK8_9BACT|nr:S9 family peptidase [Hymenobacter jejuensis]QDA59243.1 S9 family peptidase [Hymenobacter jejuensis]